MPDNHQSKDIRPSLPLAANEGIGYLFEAYHGRIYQVCFRLMGQQQEAEDITQDVFLKAYQAYDRFRGDSDPGTWLYRIAVNQCLNQQRKQRRQRWLALDFWNENTDEALDEKGRVGGADEHLQEADKKRIVRAAISELPERQRVALILSRYDRLSYQDIAVVMACSISSVESLLHRSKFNLAKRLRPYLQDL
ncbi:MAG: RNA polymerase sigma factor [Gemmatimonadota bacterium]|nr:RNA polymerase sigma factor [Gemmatimonadota bacterium]